MKKGSVNKKFVIRRYTPLNGWNKIEDGEEEEEKEKKSQRKRPVRNHSLTHTQGLHPSSEGQKERWGSKDTHYGTKGHAHTHAHTHTPLMEVPH